MSPRPPATQAFLFVGVLLAAGGCFQADPEDLKLLHLDGTETDQSPISTGSPGSAGTGPAAEVDAAPAGKQPVLLGFDCVSPVKGKYHPDGYGDSNVHGAELKAQKDDCRSCHGQKLEGCDFAGGCDNCHDGGHQPGWRADCTYCHGGQNNDTGAPPNDLIRSKKPTDLSFLAHDAHVVGTLHAPYECTECHALPTDLLSAGHVFDDTPGKVEVSFEGGLSAGGTYDGNGSCANLYCHGNRIEPGAAQHDQALTDCNSCHAFDDAKKLSGRHDEHVNGGLLGFLFDRVACNECHSAVVSAEGDIIGPELHVNGQVDYQLEQNGITYDGTRCNGTCHNAPHTFISTWQP